MLLEGGDPEQVEMVLLAKKGSLKLLEMVNALLDVSRLEGGAMPLERVPVSVHELVSEVLEMEQPLALPGNLHLLNEVPPDLPEAVVDRSIVSRVLQNLVGNAIKFTPAGGHIRVRAEVSPGELQIAVADDGKGLPDDVRTRLFEKVATGRQEGTGTGLGLRFCRLAVEAHGGRIWVESSPAGATFKFTLPLSSSH
jgi:signal transduction histidine kinase